MFGEPRNSSRELPFVGRHVRIFAGSWRLPRRGCWDAATERFVAAVECASTTVTEHGYQVVRPRPTPATNHHDSPTGQAPVSRSEPRARGADPGVGAICSVRPSTTTLCCAATGLVPRPMAQSSFSAAGTGGRAAHGGARVQAGCVVTGALGLRCGWEREERTPSRPPGLGDDHRGHPGRRRRSGSSSRPSPRIAAETPGQRRADSATRADAIDFLDSIASEPPGRAGRAGERGGGMKAPRATARCTRRR